jgi:hypothetical protein
MLDKNVKIPCSLLAKIIDLLEYWEDIRVYDWSIQQDYDDVLFALHQKKQALSLREAYARIIYAPDEDSRHDARMEYLSQKRRRLIEDDVLF